MSKRTQDFQTIRSEGGLLPPDLLRRVTDPKAKLEGTLPEDYGLPKGERLNEVITQSWNRLRRHWGEFRAAAASLPEGEAGTGLTNDKWNLPLFRELGFGLLPTTAGPEIAGRTYAINRFFGPVPIHLIGCGLSLDRRAAGMRGASAVNPHGLVQEFLNRSEGHLWAILSNGLRLRFLRDNQALSRQSYLEFDLESMFSGEVYSDFVLLWLTTHATRFAPQASDLPESCWLEKWTKIAEQQGTRALTELRGGVERALEILGQGLVGHPRNTALREALRSGNLTLKEFHGQLLRIVYRLIFLFVAEDRTLDGRPLLHPIDESEAARLARERYAAHYSMGRLRDLASRIKGSRHGDLWQQFQLTVGALSGDERFAPMREALALPILGSMLWNPESTSLINGPGLASPGTELTNFDFLEALRLLAFTRQGKVLRPVDYKNLGSEEFGGVYESFLALTPQISGDGARFTFAEFAGNERKTSGSYYTPDSLVQCLLDSALDPVVEARLADAERLAKADWSAVEKEIQSDPARRFYVLAFLTKRAGAERDAPADALQRAWDSIPPTTRRGQLSEEALLAIKVCDKACGSGHFLVGAAHRLARHLSRVRAQAAGESEPSPLLYQTALRDVIGHCLYGVDINPMSVELCKVTLWLEALEPGKPLSFLDHHILCGNSLLGATPELMDQGIPDDAFTAIEGDDKKYCANFKKENKLEARNAEKELQTTLFDRENLASEDLSHLAADIAQLSDLPDHTPDQIRAKEQRYAELVHSSGYLDGRLVADAWCAAFVWKKCPPADGGFDYPITNDLFWKLQRNPLSVPPWMREEIQRLASQYQFFHWHIAFPEVFAQGGFDVNLGNPPWETLSPDAKEFFSTFDPEVRNQDKDGQAAIIERLLLSPGIASAWAKSRRDIFAVVHFIKDSGRYQLFAEGNLGKGDFNLYRMFVETALQITRKGGFATQFVPEGFYNGANCAAIRNELFTKWRLELVLGFENTKEIWFKDVHTALKFTLYAARLSGPTDRFLARFNIRNHEALGEVQRGIGLQVPVSMVREFSPDALAIMEFGDQRDIDIATKMYARWPKFGDESAGPPMRTYMREFDMGGDREVFGNDPDGLPLYEGRMVDLFDHRAKGYRSGRGRSAVWEELPFGKPDKSIQPQWRVPLADIPEKVRGRMDRYRIGFCDVASPTNERTLYAALLPPGTVSGHKVPTILFTDGWDWAFMLWIAVANSFAMDFIARKKVSLSMSYTVLDSLPFPRMAKEDPLARKLVPMALRLTCCGSEMADYWNSMAAEGWVAPFTPGGASPGVENEDERLKLRADLDALVARDIFGLTAVEMDYILATFPTWREREEKLYGEFRTHRLILEAFDRTQ